VSGVLTGSGSNRKGDAVFLLYLGRKVKEEIPLLIGKTLERPFPTGRAVPFLVRSLGGGRILKTEVLHSEETGRGRGDPAASPFLKRVAEDF